ncbi:MAG: HAD family phosphatase [Chlamydiota bacterium]
MKLAVFDLDGTLIRGNSSFNFCFYLIKKGVLPRCAVGYTFWNYLSFHCGKRSLLDLHKKIFDALLKGLKISCLEEHMQGFLEQFLLKSCYSPAVESLRAAQHLGFHTLISSNAPSFLVKAVAHYFGVDSWHATEYAVDEDKKLSHIVSVMQGKDKAVNACNLACILGINVADIIAYTDSYLDLPLLKIAGESIGVNPDRALRKACKQFNWKII